MSVRRTLTFAGALSILSVAAGPVYAQSGLYFYCYAPDPESGTVYMSQPQPAGPVAERAGYGAAYVAYLRSKKHIKSAGQAYCTMRGSDAELARAQQQLPRESCPECEGVNRFTQVAWPRGGPVRNPNPSITVLRAPPPVPPIKSGPATEVVNFDTLGIAVLGHAATGRLVRMIDQPDALSRAKAQASAIEPSGWTTLLANDKPGFGVVICVEQDETTRFFPIHGLPSQRAAVDTAKAEARTYIGKHGGVETACGAPWQAGAGDFQSTGEPGTLDSVKSLIEKEVSCDPSLPPLSSRPSNKDMIKETAPGEAKPCTSGRMALPV